MIVCLQILNLRASVILSGAILCFAVPFVAMAGSVTAPECDALVSVTNDLYLVNMDGKILRQFTHGGAAGVAKEYAAVSPDGMRVAYATLGGDQYAKYQVATADGEARSFPVYDPELSGLDKFAGMGALMGLTWSSNDVLKLEKHASPSASFFEFRRLGPGDGMSSRERESQGIGSACVLRRESRRVACIRTDEGGASVSVNGKDVFYDSQLSLASPVATFTITKGSGVTTGGNPDFLIKVVGFDKGTIGLEVVSPNGSGATSYLPSGALFPVWWDGRQYGFSVSLVDRAGGVVRVSEVVGAEVGAMAFDSVIAWQPHGPGLLLIRRTAPQPMLYLIQPREVSGEEGEPGGVHGMWTLVAKTPIAVTGSVTKMRFVTPMTLLLGTARSAFDMASVEILDSEGDRSASALKVGSVTPMPSTVSVAVKGSVAKPPVLGWSCESHHRKHQGD